MKHFKTPNFFASIAILIVLLLVGCDNESNLNGLTVSVSNEDAFISFSAGSQPDVIFNHKVHSEQYWDNNCFECHSHGDVRDTTQCQCSECHSDEDSEGLCADDAENHDCMYVQCKRCHDTIDPNPTPNCSDCHVTVASGVFLDSAVQGLTYETTTQSGSTDSNGTFAYQVGETVTFSIGSTVLGSATGKAIITPIDLVPGATDETHQAVTNLARFLMTLDSDDVAANGLSIPNSAIDAIGNRALNFDQTPTAFESDAQVLGILANLNNKPLCTVADAQTHLRSTLDTLFPPATGTRINGIANTNLLLTGLFDVTAGTTYIYKWYRSLDASCNGEEEITGASSTTYQPTASDVDRCILFEVTPDAVSGTPDRSSWTSPVSNAATINSDFATQQEVDSYTFRLTNPTNTVTIDVESYEAADYSGCGHGGHFSCFNCHGSSEPGPTDFFSNGCSNDQLVTNIYLYRIDNGSLGTIEASKDGLSPCAAAGGATGYPGCDDPDAFSTRNGRNPRILNQSLTQGDYILFIGAQNLSVTDAQNAFTNSNSNSDGSSFFTTATGDGFTSYGSRYRITFSFN